MNDIYLVDVDDVLLNTPELKEKLIEFSEQIDVQYENYRDPDLLLALDKAEPGFLKSLVYKGGKEFLEKFSGKCFLVSTAKSSSSANDATERELAFQKLKIKLCGLEDLVGGKGNVRVSAGEKDESLEEFVGKNALFIDNSIGHLRVAHSLGIDTAHMLREHLKQNKNPEGIPEMFTESRFNISSFRELLNTLETSELVDA